MQDKKTPSRRQAVSDESRQLLEQSATALFASRMYDEISIDVIAQNAGMTKGAFYHHFQSKKEIFEACYRSQIERIIQSVNSRKDASDAVEAAIEKTGAFLQFVLSHHTELISLDKAISVLGWPLWKKMESEAFFPLISQSLSQLQTESRLVNQPIPLLCDMLHGILFNAVMSMAHAANPKSSMQDSMAIFKRFFNALIESS